MSAARTWSTATTLLAGLLVGVLPSTARAELNEDCRQLGGGLTDHTCFHTDFGPFADVTAGSENAPLAAAPDISDVHTHYTVTLPESRRGVVRYEPKRGGAWAVFSTAGVEVEIRDTAGNPVPSIGDHDVTTCDALPQVRVFDLESESPYLMALRADPNLPVALVIENIQDFEVAYGPDLDGDGFGSSEGSIVTSCVPPEGFVAELGDCDDSDPAINPGAAELCDGIDNNCNGAVDAEDEQSPCAPDEDLLSDRGCSCAAGPGHEGSAQWLSLVLLALVRRRSRR